MGCAASSGARAVAPTPQPNPGSRSAGNAGGLAASSAHDPRAAGKAGAVEGCKGVGGAGGKDEVVAFQPTDEERSKNNTPAANVQDKGLGATSPKPDAPADKELAELSPDSSPQQGSQGDPHVLPSVMEPLPAPVDVDAMKLPAAEPSLVPYWEKDPLPMRPGTSSRRPQSSGGKKLVVYKTEKTKKMEAESRKKRGEEPHAAVASPDKTPKRVSSLPPIKARRKKAQSDASFEVLTTPLKERVEGGGAAWDINTSDLTGPSAKPAPDVFTMDDDAPEPSPERPGAPTAEVFVISE